ncbi:hypothetical protein FDX06_19025 [Citrobacter sp. wls618]|uniref:Uncharacterized protein n=1 Tax=Citrobacter braakii TaxID=57706 RepID=A0A1V8P657_CITBR|nr:hypothetical protein CEP69_01550 [Citrobacter braakii]PAX77598.1 hypothetical protein CIK43_22430 [Citrobacter sp. TSA-1]PLC62040.1 hypothetical protein B9P82_16470 [Citrobacter sp. L55]TKU02303.1 hypothetical protein FDW91_06580 [Citrobacter sp. wls831]TKU32416.1 hypothetical protein FDW99_04415 [Citrobacter sp. wls758]TKV01068.1 hypothetical protein FDX06_19025 [Citrobacter sp. wls618]
MIRSLKKFLLWQLRFLSSLYGPVIFTIIFALLQGYFFPDSPVWPTGVFAIVMIVIFTRYCKW